MAEEKVAEASDGQPQVGDRVVLYTVIWDHITERWQLVGTEATVGGFVYVFKEWANPAHIHRVPRPLKTDRRFSLTQQGAIQQKMDDVLEERQRLHKQLKMVKENQRQLEALAQREQMVLDGMNGGNHE